MKIMKIKLKHGLSQTIKAPEGSTFFVKVEDGFMWFRVRKSAEERPRLVAAYRADRVKSVHAHGNDFSCVKLEEQCQTNVI